MKDKEKYIKNLIETYQSIVDENNNIIKDEKNFIPDWQWCELIKEKQVYQLVIKNLKKI
jgi:hypothetical protein